MSHWHSSIIFVLGFWFGICFMAGALFVYQGRYWIFRKKKYTYKCLEPNCGFVAKSLVTGHLYDIALKHSLLHIPEP